MLKRTLVFSSPMILSLKNQQLVLAYKDSPDEKQTVPIEDVGIIIHIWGSVEKKNWPTPLQIEFF